MALAVLSIDLVAQLASLQAGMDKAGRIAEKQANQIEARYARMQNLAAGVGAALGGAISAAGITQFLRATVDGVDALNDLADATGASVENISALEDIAARTGTTMDTVGGALVKLNQVLAAADPDTPMARALKAVGLNAAELRKLDPAEALRRTAVALASYADDGNKARLVGELFGKSVREVAPLLKDLAEAGRLNATVTTEQAKAAEDFNKQISQLSKGATDAAREIAGPLVSALNQFFDAIQGRGVGGASGISEALIVPLQTAAVVGANLQFVFRGIGTEIGGLAAQAAAMGRLDFSGAKAIGQAMRDDAKAAREQFDLLEQRLLNIGRVIPQADYSNEGRVFKPSVPVVPTKPTGTGAAGVPRPFISNSFDQATIAALRAMESTDTNKLRELNLALTGLFELQRETRGDPAVAQAIAKVRAEIDALSTKTMPDAGPVQAYTDALAALQDTDATRIAALSAALDELFKMRETGLYGPEVDQAIEGLRNRLEGLKKPLSEVNTFAEEAGKNIQDALGSSLLSSMEGNTASIGHIWGDMLKRMAAQAAAAQLGKWMLGGDFGKTGNIGGAAGELFNWLGSFGGARASGGPVRAGRPYLVGERGPEIVVPKTAGTVLPNGVAPGGGAGGGTFNVIVQGDASENTIRLVQGALAQFEARMLLRGA